VRTQSISDKLLHLLAELQHGLGFDLFVCADETGGQLPDGTLPPWVGVLRHSEASLGPLGLVEILRIPACCGSSVTTLSTPASPSSPPTITMCCWTRKSPSSAAIPCSSKA